MVILVVFYFLWYLARKLVVFISVPLSYGIFEEKIKYSKLFNQVSNPKNFGEITFFIKGMFEIIIKGQENIIEMLKNKVAKLKYAIVYIKELDLNNMETKILFLYI